MTEPKSFLGLILLGILVFIILVGLMFVVIIVFSGPV